jgi:hypothetical protein
MRSCGEKVSEPERAKVIPKSSRLEIHIAFLYPIVQTVKFQTKVRRAALPAYYHRTCPVQTHEVKDCLAQIDADCVEFHGPPPVPPLIARRA